jgi:hypothetical protein
MVSKQAIKTPVNIEDYREFYLFCREEGICPLFIR